MGNKTSGSMMVVFAIATIIGVIILLYLASRVLAGKKDPCPFGGTNYMKVSNPTENPRWVFFDYYSQIHNKNIQSGGEFMSYEHYKNHVNHYVGIGLINTIQRDCAFEQGRNFYE